MSHCISKEIPVRCYMLRLVAVYFIPVTLICVCDVMSFGAVNFWTITQPEFFLCELAYLVVRRPYAPGAKGSSKATKTLGEGSLCFGRDY